ncbi:MAG: hypothetical protein Ct9H300mP28_14350 [Pseudomonadota bacterium]|nr:MAG: hypothetical protein Ct9H300mP28_14350 [Pseudomonadota bacterium]
MGHTRGLEKLNINGTYLVISNHLSLLDIPTLQRVFFKQIPFLRFFYQTAVDFFSFSWTGGFGL